ncbi:MAG: hypothetical protein C0505_09980 [Leptothrix sp. (in: Bacteria)]|nr:hypothetical protein [Leptothrix sp. (in: b-proteobacteria)]
MAMLFLDLGRFKQLSHSRSHGVGDLALRAVGGAPLRGTRVTHLLARRGALGGDEFAVLLPELAQEGAELEAQRVAPPVHVMLKSADELMYRAKQAGGGAAAACDFGVRLRVAMPVMTGAAALGARSPRVLGARPLSAGPRAQRAGRSSWSRPCSRLDKAPASRWRGARGRRSPSSLPAGRRRSIARPRALARMCTAPRSPWVALHLDQARRHRGPAFARGHARQAACARRGPGAAAQSAQGT